MVKGIVVGAVAVTALAAGGVGYKVMTKPVFAEVVAAKEVKETVKTPREECEDVAVQHQAPVKDEHRIAGTVVGAVAGGLLGSAIGGGTGKKVATVAGAAAGGYAGNRVQKNLQEKDVQTTTERRCKTVYDTSVKHLGYDVTYRLDGRQDVVRMAFDPGQQIPVKDGKLVLDPPAKN
ncbi:glycine zipper 2TM domain-containing protein [Propionivibrio sp.]|uniref:glycine zipper 2TM domain-containing protein n=1 Tax=Propionivibrio sp. TaxID=2212460 RepID=UPI0039E33A0A